jgi:hypothetical protein
MVDLEPPATNLADLLVRMTELEWPTGDEDRLRFFDRLGLHDVESLQPDYSNVDTEARHFITALPGAVRGNGTMFRGEFLGLSLFPYNEPVENGLLATAGYAALRDLLSHRLGPPTEEWGTANEPACLWRLGPLFLTLYCFQRHDSGVQVGVSHATRSAAFDAAAA